MLRPHATVSKFHEIAELSGAAAPRSRHFARVLDRGTKADRCLEWLEKTSPHTPDLKEIAVAPRPHHFAMILDRGMKADRCLEWLEKPSLQTPNLKKSLIFEGLLPLDIITLLGYWKGA